MIVPAYGPTPASVLVVGERPGHYESVEGIPFVGPSGLDLERYLSRGGISLERCRRTNICRDFIDGNPDPTPKEIAQQAGELRAEIQRTNPVWVIAVGRIAARTLTGLDLSMESAHGMVFPAADEWCVNNPRVIVAYHPAFALRSPDMVPVVAADYLRAGAYVKGTIPATTPVDDFAGHEDYRELDDDEYGTIEELCDPSHHHWGGLAVDTEGYRLDPWMIQLSAMPGTGYIINRRQHALMQFLDDEIVRQKPLVIFHHALHDLEVMRALGLVAPTRFTDTMVLAYLLQTEPQGLKALARRHAGMEMFEYKEVIRPAQANLARLYFSRVIAALEAHPEWEDRPEEVVIDAATDTARIKTPHSIAMRIRRIVKDQHGAVRKGQKETKPIDYLARWKALPDEFKDQVSAACGPMPVATLMNVSRGKRIRYAARDPDATLRVYEPLYSMVEALDLTRVLDLDLATVPMFERMQSNGFELNVPALETLSAHLAIEMRKSMRTVGCNPAPNSKQLVTVFDGLGIARSGRVTEKLKLPQIDDGYLEGLETDLAIAKSPDYTKLNVVRAVIHYRECSKIESTYARPLVKLMDKDGRLRTHFGITAREGKNDSSGQTVTGRPTSRNPNLLNIPVRTELGRRVRAAFVARYGYVLATADYAGIEMRLMAHASGDENMIKVFREDKDIHSQTASRAFGIPERDLDPMKHRYPAKRMGFLVIFGGGPRKLQRELAIVGIRWPLDDCERLISDYTKKIYPGIDIFMTARQTEAKRNGFVRDPLSGRIRHLPDAASPDKWKQLAAFREAVNFPIQTGAATIMKRGMRAVWDKLPELWQRGYAEPLLQQYDELTFEVEDKLVMSLKDIVIPGMRDAVELSVPIKVSWGTGRTWAELEK